MKVTIAQKTARYAQGEVVEMADGKATRWLNAGLATPCADEPKSSPKSEKAVAKKATTRKG